MIISFLSAKGGVGKTTIVANLGIALTKFFSKRVLLVDGNITTPTLGIHLGILSQQRTINEVLSGDLPIKECIYIHPSEVHLIPASLEPLEEYPDPLYLKDRLKEVKEEYDFILIDGAAGIGREVIGALKASDGYFLVCNPEMTSIIASMKAMKIGNKLEKEFLGIILNKVEGKKYELKVEKIEDITNARVVVKLPFEKKVIESIKKMEPLVAYNQKCKFSKEIIKLASLIVGEFYEEKPSIFKKILQFFKLK